MDKNTDYGGSGLVEIISGIVTVGIGIGIGLYVLGSIKQRMIEEERNDTIYTCDFCGEDYRFGDSGSTEFCSESCKNELHKKKGGLLICRHCRRSYFENEGYGGGIRNDKINYS